ncbi:hypothetical protein IWZ01DRAFT_131313 [Phyllosticta capitalensis]
MKDRMDNTWRTRSMCGHRAYIHGLQVPRTHASSRDAIKICSNCRLAGLRWCLRRRPLLMDGRCLAEKLDWCGFCLLLSFLFFLRRLGGWAPGGGYYRAHLSISTGTRWMDSDGRSKHWMCDLSTTARLILPGCRPPPPPPSTGLSPSDPGRERSLLDD